MSSVANRFGSRLEKKMEKSLETIFYSYFMLDFNPKIGKKKLAKKRSNLNMVKKLAKKGCN